MSTKDTLINVLENAANIAVATKSVDGKTPNVRIVNFLYFPNESENTIYFATSKDANKVKELAANGSVAFTTIPAESGIVRVTDGEAKLANDSKDKVLDAMAKKYGDASSFDQKARDGMNNYAVTFKEAAVMGQESGTVSFN
jgi:uncharacterized pyridoxamine 5'-phosphate oxidase family protein